MADDLVQQIADVQSKILDALLAAEEILEVLSQRGTRGVEQECNAARVLEVFKKVRAAKRLDLVSRLNLHEERGWTRCVDGETQFAVVGWVSGWTEEQR